MSLPDAQPIAVSRRIEATPDVLFAMLADPTLHPALDGSGMLREALSTGRIHGVGDTFTMTMHNEEMGQYEITNHVVEFELDRRIAWTPVLTGASREEDQPDIGDRNHHVWAFELSPADTTSTLVTESYDCSRSPEWLRKAVRNGERWRQSMNNTLDNLDKAAASTRT
jgi:hypothetical protein